MNPNESFPIGLIRVFLEKHVFCDFPESMFSLRFYVPHWFYKLSGGLALPSTLQNQPFNWFPIGSIRVCAFLLLLGPWYESK